jgi:hypothetical protein
MAKAFRTEGIDCILQIHLALIDPKRCCTLTTPYVLMNSKLLFDGIRSTWSYPDDGWRLGSPFSRCAMPA